MVVTAHLVEPIVYARDGIHLDGLLSHAAVLELDAKTRRRMTPLSSECPPDVALPLARWRVPVRVDDEHTARLCYERTSHALRQGAGILWGWCASAEDAHWLLHGRAEVRKKPSFAELARYSDAPSVNVAAGAMKAYDLALPTVQAHRVRWYALGNPDAVAHLLRTHVRALGRKRGTGWGLVDSWEVEPRAEDWSVERWEPQSETLILMRRMPRECRFEGRQSIAAIRPPYFHASRCVPTTEPAL